MVVQESGFGTETCCSSYSSGIKNKISNLLCRTTAKIQQLPESLPAHRIPIRQLNNTFKKA